eukprot:452831_1
MASERSDIIQQLREFGYNMSQITNALSVVQNKNNIHEIIDAIDKQQHPSFDDNLVTQQPVDFTVLCSKSEQCTTLSGKCDFTNRVIEGLKYCATLDITNNTLDMLRLVEFCETKYKLLLDDSIHLFTCHTHRSDDLNVLMNNYPHISCDTKKCMHIRRHYRNRHHDQSQQSDLDFVFYRDILDGIHCYLSHIYDVGLRIYPENRDMQHEYKEQEYKDSEFAIICKVTNQKKNELKFNGINTDRFNNKKFEMNGNAGFIEHATFIDGVYNDLSSSIYQTNNLKMFIIIEEYDTDALIDDIENDYRTQSNMSRYLNNEAVYDFIKQYVTYTKLQKHSFSIGFIFYYWNYYKNKNLKPLETQYFQNRNAHSGYHYHELFIINKYSCIKEEILNNKIHTLKVYQYKISINKVNKFIHTQKVKSMKANGSIYLHYGITNGTDISFSNLLSVILYCDWSELCTQFSATFRRNEPHEQLSSVKSRNREFAVWAKTLRETVQFFGQMGYDYQYAEHVNRFNNRFKGPFFCGLTSFMIIPEFQIRLCGPTSTSKQISVATRFGGEHGMIIQLNNNGHYQVKFLRSFCCCWLSNYNGEDEYL